MFARSLRVRPVVFVVAAVVLFATGCTTTDSGRAESKDVTEGSGEQSIGREGWSKEIVDAIETKDVQELADLLESGQYDVNAVGEHSGYMSVALKVAEEDEEAAVALMNEMIDAGVDLSIGSEVSRDGESQWVPVTDAAVVAGQFDIAYYLVTSGADLAELEDSTINVLMIMATLRDSAPYSTALSILEEDPNPAAAFMYDDGTKVSALLVATQQEKWPIAEGLLQLPQMTAEVANFVDRRGTALMHTAFAGNEELVADLLEEGADPNISGYGNFTALILATQNEDVRIVEMLLDAGADPEFENDNGDSAEELAVATENNALIALFDR